MPGRPGILPRYLSRKPYVRRFCRVEGPRRIGVIQRTRCDMMGLRVRGEDSYHCSSGMQVVAQPESRLLLRASW